MPLRMCYNSKFGRSTSKGDKAVVGRNPQNWAALETRWDGVMVHPKTRPFLTSYHAKFVQIWSFYAKGHRHLGYPKNKSTLGPTQWDGSALPLQTRPSGCWSNGTSVLMDICWKTWFPHVPPFEVTQDHRN